MMSTTPVIDREQRCDLWQSSGKPSMPWCDDWVGPDRIVFVLASGHTVQVCEACVAHLSECKLWRLTHGELGDSIRSRYNPARGGHAPLYLRKAVQALLKSGTFHEDIYPARLWPGTRTQRTDWLIGQLWDCTDPMPDWVCSLFRLPIGSTYARGVRALRRAYDFVEPTLMERLCAFVKFVQTKEIRNPAITGRPGAVIYRDADDLAVIRCDLVPDFFRRVDWFEIMLPDLLRPPPKINGTPLPEASVAVAVDW